MYILSAVERYQQNKTVCQATLKAVIISLSWFAIEDRNLESVIHTREGVPKENGG